MRRPARRKLYQVLIAAFALGFAVVPLRALAENSGPLVFAAASLKDALDTISADWQKASGIRATISYAASSALAKQIEQGAPADLFIAADEDWMDYLAARKLIKPETRFDLIGNRLVLIAPKDSTLTATIAPSFPLAGLLSGGRLAMADTTAVPAGRYGKAALQRLGVWDAVKEKLAQGENVRAALALVSRGEAPLGIVYATDAEADPKVKVLGAFPEETHPPILYPAAETAASRSPNAQAFLAYLKSPAAQGVFAARRFKMLSADAAQRDAPR
jgi:molybdate transport system substrate-binding protein